jgi:4-hydroxy-tetrahydrodipicolinate synthase
MPRLMRAMFDQTTAFDRRKLVPHIAAGDNILSRRPFIASVKAVLADATGIDAWARVLPPMSELPLRERDWMLRDFRRWEASLPPAWRSLYRDGGDAEAKVVAIRRA